MQNNKKKKIAYLFVLVLFITSCASNHFNKRKYTAGNYRENRHHLPKTSEIKEDNSTFDISDKHLVAVADSSEKEMHQQASNVFDKTLMISKPKLYQLDKLSNYSHIKIRKTKNYYKKFPIAKKTDINNQIPKNIDTHALVGFIFAIMALTCAVIGILLLTPIASSIAYTLIIASIVLGLISLPLGLGGLKNYRNYDGSQLDLAFSIVSTIVGWIAVIALVLGIIIALLIIMFLLLLI